MTRSPKTLFAAVVRRYKSSVDCVWYSVIDLGGVAVTVTILLPV